MEYLEKLELQKQRRIESMPHTYTDDYNPDFSHAQELYDDSASEIKSMGGVASAEDIETALIKRGQMARDEVKTVIVTTGNCEREIAMGDDPDAETEQTVTEICNQEQIVNEELVDAEHCSRDINQNYKPRTEEFEKNPDGTYKFDDHGNKIPSFYGSGFNGNQLDQRTPDPSRAVAGALYARDICEHYLKRTGKRLSSAHEALSLLLEENSVRDVNGMRYLVSGIRPWVGNRTRSEGSPQLTILGSVRNPVAVKIDGNTTPEDIEMLYETLNPDEIDGKVTFILRLGVKHLDKASVLVGAIQEKAPLSLIASDPFHGNTKTAANNYKTRELPDAEAEMLAVSQACKRNGTRLHELHIEANGRDDIEECVDEKGMQPSNKSRVDPCANNRQLRRLLRFYRTHCR